ncbi:unnamed protein product, partial [Pylaiella littoralis]
MARVFVLLCVQAMIPDKSYTQQACFPLLADVLGVKIRCFHLGATASTNAGGNWCKQTFPPKKPSLRKLSPIPTVYL